MNPSTAEGEQDGQGLGVARYVRNPERSDTAEVRRITVDERDRALVRLVVDLSAVLGLDGRRRGCREDALTLDALADIGCGVAQGLPLRSRAAARRTARAPQRLGLVVRAG